MRRFSAHAGHRAHLLCAPQRRHQGHAPLQGNALSHLGARRGHHRVLRRLQPTALGVDYAGSAGRSGGPQPPPMLSTPLPPPGVDAGAFYNLVDIRRRGYGGNLLNIDRANNNTSLVFALEWRGWRLLFPGDAEHRSWKTMAREKVLKPVHFLKVSHHGSFNGTPDVELLDQIPPNPTSPARARAPSCPPIRTPITSADAETLALLGERCTLRGARVGRW